MNQYEKLLQTAEKKHIQVIENYEFQSSRIKGLYCDGIVALNKHLETDKEKACILAEELAHHDTGDGNIIELSDSSNTRQEARARFCAYNRLVGLQGIINAYEAHCHNLHETADYLEVTEEFLTEALDCYRSKYGLCTRVEKYIIYFEPCFGVIKML